MVPVRQAAWSAVPAGVGLGDGEAEGFEFGDELAQAAVVVEPGAVVGELVVGQDAGGGPAVFLGGPLVVGAVQLRGSAWQRQPRWPQRVIRSATVPGSLTGKSGTLAGHAAADPGLVW